jgi:glycosyltransferase involved in cell wall biosynthesis
MTEKVLLTVCMILKDEVHTIRKTLESALSVADRFCILDTGSTDGTQVLLREVLGDKLDLHEEPFIDFSTSRNRCLDLAGQDATFILSLDADDVLVGADRLREFLTSVKGLKDDGYNLTLKTSGNSTSFLTCRLFRAEARWRYKGVVHEMLLPPRASSYSLGMRLVDGVHIDHFPDAVGNEKTKSRWERDVKLLSSELEANPKDTRSCFYLARTLSDLSSLPGQHMRGLEAFRAFERRWKMGGGFQEEVFCSRLYAARCARRAGLPWSACVGMWLAAHECDPRRVEPLADLASEHSGRDEHAQCVLFASRAMALPPPHEGALFTEDHSWLMAHLVGWHAFYLPGEDELGIAACKRAIELRPTDCAQDAKNLENFMARKGKRTLSSKHLSALRSALAQK